MEDILADVLHSTVRPPPRGGGSTLFVINLCASMAPVAVSGKSLPGLDNYKLYQVARVEDGRPRHRLRLGFFNTESDAEAVLEIVRARYPTAFTTCLGDDDRKFARGFLPPTLQNATDTAIVRTINAVVDGLSPAMIAASAARKSPAPAPHPAPPVKATKPAPVSVVTRAAEEPIKATQRPAARAPEPESDVTEISWSPPALTPTPVKVVAVDKRFNRASVPAAATNNATVAPSTAKLPTAKVVAARAPAAAKPIAAPKLHNGARTASTSAKHAAPAAPKLATKAPATPAPQAQAKPTPAKPAAPAAPAARTTAPAAALSLEASKPIATTPAPATASSAPFRVDRGIQVPQTGLTLEAEAAAPKPAQQRPAAAAPAPTPAPKAPAPVAKPAQPQITAKAPIKPTAPVAPARQPAPAAKAAPTPAAAAKPAGKPVIADLDSTQTIRALTAAELNDANQPKWFVVQLAISEQAINLDTMPHLDIFAAYRLYSVATAGSGKILHSLRLGFFKEEVSAQAVAGYLKTFFNSPSVIRIATSEQLRFAEPMGARTTQAQAPTAEKEDHKVIELSEVRDRIGKALEVVPTVTMAIEPPKKPSSAPKSAQKSAGTATKRSSPSGKYAPKSAGASGKHRSLNEELMEEARQVHLSESAIRKLPKNDSLLSKLVDKLKK